MFCRRTKTPPKTWSVSGNQQCDPLLHCSNEGMLIGFARKTNPPWKRFVATKQRFGSSQKWHLPAT